VEEKEKLQVEGQPVHLGVNQKVLKQEKQEN